MNGKRHYKQSKKTNDKLEKKIYNLYQRQKVTVSPLQRASKIRKKEKTLHIEKVANEKESSQKKKKNRNIYDYEKMIILKEI